MKGFELLKIKSGVRSRNKMDMRYSHLAGMQIGQAEPISIYDMVPGDEVTFNSEYFSRVAPLARPTYGNFLFKTMTGFVAYHMIAADAEAWLAGKTSWEGVTPLPRFFRVQDLFSTISTPGNALSTSVGATNLNCDFTYLDSAGVRQYRIYTAKGKYFMKILNGLGYSLPTGVDLQTGSAYLTYISVKQLSAYPLLCFAKLYNDYMSQSQRFNTSLLSNLLNAIKYGRAYSGLYDNTLGRILAPGIFTILNAIVVCYENDYFTSAWQSANNPLANIENVSSVDVPADGVTISETLADNQAGLPTAGGFTQLPQRVLDFLKSFDAWVRRNNYSGSRAVQQIFSRFGIKTSDYRDHYAEVLKVSSFPMQVGDVTATADSGGVPLGDYAGKAILAGNDSVHYKASDFGCLINIGFITVVPMNPYGFDRRVLRVNPLDYYNPEFDGLGADAISVGELYADPIDESGSVLDDSVFGFTERYNAYRYCRDVLTGDFRNYHRDADMNAWHTGRNLSSIRQSGYLLAQNVSVNTLPQTDSEYNRIFSNVYAGDVDHFYMICKFRLDAVRPMKNLNQVVGLGEGNLVVPRNGNEVS